jgi:hypothetical protein
MFVAKRYYYSYKIYPSKKKGCIGKPTVWLAEVEFTMGLFVG